MFIEHRRQARRGGFQIGSLFFHEHPQQAECLVWNLSDLGAMIEVETSTIIPSYFRLIATSLGINRGCKVVWRDGRKIGLEYIRG